MTARKQQTADPLTEARCHLEGKMLNRNLSTILNLLMLQGYTISYDLNRNLSCHRRGVIASFTELCITGAYRYISHL